MKNLFNPKKPMTDIRKNNILTGIVSVIIAIIIWFLVAASVYQSTTTPVNNIPVDIRVENSIAERNGLSITNTNIPAISAVIDGNRAVIGNMKADDLEAYVDLDTVTSPGIYELPVEIKGRGIKNFTVNSIYPPTIKLEFVKIISKEFEVKAIAPDATAADGYITETPKVTPNVITITGPEEKVNDITSCVVHSNYKNSAMVENFESAEGNELIVYSDKMSVDQKDLTIDKTNFVVRIPVYQKKTVELIPEFKNLPPDFPKDKIKYKQDVREIEVAVPTDDTRKSITLGVIDIHEIDLGTVKKFPVKLPDGYKNLSGVDTVTLTFEEKGMARKTFEVNKNDIIITNAPSDYDISLITSGFNVTFVGPEDVIEKLTILDIVAEADMSSIAEFQNNVYFNSSIKFYISTDDCVWSLGRYNAVFISKEKKD